jgi:hypothetical protein
MSIILGLGSHAKLIRTTASILSQYSFSRFSAGYRFEPRTSPSDLRVML